MVAASNQNKMSNDNTNVAPNLYLQLGDDFQYVKMGLMDPFPESKRLETWLKMLRIEIRNLF